MADPIRVERIKAGQLAWFLKAGLDGKYARIGKDNDELTIAHNRPNEKTQNVWNEMAISTGGLEATMDVAPFYCLEGEPVFEWLWGLYKENAQFDQLKTKFCEVELWNGTIKEAREQTVYVNTTLHGVSAAEGMRIEYTLDFVGDTVKGLWEPGIAEIEGQQTGTFTPEV